MIKEKLIHPFVFVGAAVLAGACAGPDKTNQLQLTDEGLLFTSGDARDIAEIRSVLREMERADSNENIDGILAVYAPGVTWLPPEGPPICGIEKIRPRYESLFEKHDVSVQILEHEIRVARPYAYCVGTTHVLLKPRDGGDPVLNQDKFLMILRYDGNWRVSHLMWSKN